MDAQSRTEAVLALRNLIPNYDNFPVTPPQETLDGRSPQTGESFLSEEAALSWTNSQKGTLWLTGGPGVGKTHLTTAVALRRRKTRLPACPVVDLYFRVSDADMPTIADIILWVIIQLVQDDVAYHNGHVVALVLQVFRKYSGLNLVRPPQRELIELYRDVVQSFEQVDILLDGVEKLPVTTQWPILNALTSGSARVFITSLPMKPVQDRLKRIKGDDICFVTFKAEPRVLRDYISDTINEYPALAEVLQGAERTDEVISRIQDQSDGIFSCAALQIQQLTDCSSIYDVETTLDTSLSVIIKEMYTNITKTMCRKDVEIVEQVLLWLFHAKEDLTMANIQHAIAVQPTTYQFNRARMINAGVLISICRGLITVDEETGRIGFFHSKLDLPMLAYVIQDPNARPHPHEVIARTCIARLTGCGLQTSTATKMDDLRQVFDQQPLLEYAHRNTTHHIAAGGDKTSRDLQTSLEDLIVGCKTFPYVPYRLINYPSYFSLLGPLHAAAAFGCHYTFMTLFQSAGNTEVTSHAAGRAVLGYLAIAAVEGHQAVVEFLLNSQLQQMSSEGTKAMTLARLIGREDIAERIERLALNGIACRPSPT